MKRYTLILISFLALSLAAHAQVTVQLKAPRQAEFGQRIEVRYVVNTTDVKDFSVGDFQGFRVLYGPATSSSSSFSMINGKTTHTSTMTYTYLVVPTEEGTLEIPAASVKVDGKTYQSRSATLEVLPASDNASAGNQQQGSAQQPQHDRHAQPQANISGKELYMTVSASKRRVYEQEAILLTYKLYTLVNIQQISGEMPQLDGFHVQELDSKAQMSLKYERVDGRNYGTAVWRQYLVYPQKTGKMRVPPITFETQIEQVNTSMDPFDIFFGGGSLAQVVRKNITAPAVEIDVQPLPTPKPDSFSGAVGRFSVSGSLTPDKLNANDAATLRLVVSGQGNMKLLDSPRIAFPADFEVYDPKTTDKTTYTTAGAKGNKVFDYVVVPRHAGQYSIPPVQYSYFDPEQARYVTVQTDSFKIDVAKAKGRTVVAAPEQEDLKVLSNDIRYIRQSPLRASSADGLTFGSGRYWLLHALALALFLGVLALFRRLARENANLANLRRKKAGKAATKRLRNAAKLMKQGNSRAFYDEVMHALLGYAGDKLNLPNTELSKDNVQELLQSKQVDETLVKNFMDVLGECEFAQYAPGDPNATMDKIFEEATEVINKLDAAIRKA